MYPPASSHLWNPLAPLLKRQNTSATLTNVKAMYTVIGCFNGVITLLHFCVLCSVSIYFV
jgi:hypothetical protein